MNPAGLRRTLPNYVFTGTMDYPPNVDAVTWFAEDILPLIRRTVPAAQFEIVGGESSAGRAAARRGSRACS